eukprot:14450631-Alexandrium_andersonii.AAC.1
MEAGRTRPFRSATARRRALRAAARQRAARVVSPPEELAAAVASHHAAMWRLAARAIETYGAQTSDLERPPAGARRVDRSAAAGGRSCWQPRNWHDAPMPPCLERP